MESLFDTGDVVPWFQAPMVGASNPFRFERTGGQHVLLLFFGSASQPAFAEAMALVRPRADLFDDVQASFFGVTVDPEDAQARGLVPSIGIHFLRDYERRISRAFGADRTVDGRSVYEPHWLLIDPTMRVIGRFTLSQGAAALAATARVLAAPALDMAAPVLAVPDVLEAGFRDEMIALYEQHGGGESGFMRQQGGQTVGMVDRQHKSRTDHMIEDEAIRDGLRQRLIRRLLPMIERGFDFRATRIERYLVACYDSETGGHFKAHRDNRTSATAHRRFAVTINLNGDYDGGDLSFPEFGPRTYRAPPGGAIVFCCTLMHQVDPVTFGRRFATLPFLYDDAAAKVREANHATLAGSTKEYRADRPAA